MKREKYQGWTNAQTWCVAGVFNNTKKLQDEVLKAVRTNLQFPRTVEMWLREIAGKNVCEVHDFAPWCWEDGETLTQDVDWSQLREHFEMKISEERQYEVEHAEG